MMHKVTSIFYKKIENTLSVVGYVAYVKSFLNRTKSPLFVYFATRSANHLIYTNIPLEKPCIR